MSMQNVEFKAELRDAGLARAICTAIGAMHAGVMEQIDTYYRIGSGRLKKRQINPASGGLTQWIFYERPDRIDARISRVQIYTEEEAMQRFGNEPLVEWVVVRKKRELFLLENVRIHLDEVEGLGSYLEFEALVTPAHTVGLCHDEIAHLRAEFGPALGEAISGGYSDLVGPGAAE